jgi:6-phosphogluconolactonase (cycloisomerase 2 family)
LVILYNVEKTEDGKINLTNSQTLSTFGDAFPPMNATSAAAGELIASHNERDIYVSNRVTGNETDNISHFLLQDGKLVFGDQISSGGLLPRQLSFSADESYIFGANQGGDSGLVAFRRGCEDGSLIPAGALPNSEVGPDTFGPQFVLEIPICP